MQDSLEVTLPSKQEEEEEEEEDEEEEEKDQPAEMEYLNSRCVLFTYFQGDIGSVVDEHFSRALGQASTLHQESAISKSKMGLTPLWRGKNSRADALQATGCVSQPSVPGSSWRPAPGGRISTRFLIFKDSKEFLSDKQLDQFCHMWNAGLERMQSHPLNSSWKVVMQPAWVYSGRTELRSTIP